MYGSMVLNRINMRNLKDSDFFFLIYICGFVEKERKKNKLIIRMENNVLMNILRFIFSVFFDLHVWAVGPNRQRFPIQFDCSGTDDI